MNEAWTNDRCTVESGHMLDDVPTGRNGSGRDDRGSGGPGPFTTNSDRAGATQNFDPRPRQDGRDVVKANDITAN